MKVEREAKKKKKENNAQKAKEEALKPTTKNT